MTGNPWEREEREKEHEIRREQIRHWRDQQISELSAVQNRSPQQEEQLKTLVLERDFERRAQETEEGEEDVDLSSRHEVIRLSNSIQTPITTMKITEEDNNNSLPIVSSTLTGIAGGEQPTTYQGYPIQQSQIVPTPSSTVQPKSILKNNRYDNSSLSNQNYPSSPSKSQKSTSFADELHPPISVTATTTSSTSVNQLTRDMNTMELNDHDIHHGTPPPPPPPERNSSYLIMSQQQKLRSSLTNNNVVNNINNNNNVGNISNSPNSSNTISNNTSKASGSEISKRTSLITNNNVVPNNNVLMTTGGGTTSTHSLNNINNNNGSGGGNMIPAGNLHSPNTSAFRDNKRVSFHDEESSNKYLSVNMNDYQQLQQQQERVDFEMVREDPNVSIPEVYTLE